MSQEPGPGPSPYPGPYPYPYALEARPPIRTPAINPPAIPGPQPQPPRASTGVGTETAVMAMTAAAEKTTAAFFMGFPFTKIVVDNERRIRWLRPQGPPERSH